MFGKHDKRQFEERAGHCGPWKHFRGGRGGFWGEMGEGWGRHGRHQFGGEFGGRLFDGGELRLVILSYIAEKPSHGYEIMKGIAEKMGGLYTPSAGVVYPTLNQLEDEGFATATTEGGKKQYTITEAGRAELEAHKSRMHNCKLALKLKFGRGDLSAEQLSKIAEILDATAKEIERV
jgi:DNA-binding PadR family transcriptional regulator